MKSQKKSPLLHFRKSIPTTHKKTKIKMWTHPIQFTKRGWAVGGPHPVCNFISFDNRTGEASDLQLTHRMTPPKSASG